ncbi:SPOR domain-containing protein [Microbulbifer sp. 2304DJ12-6]|uniref:SPOR domain-containing protein n=1 Tax=Microbulbifer sp. 2304DJ12-6 TaxID=3233340 RepID=UPI0039B07C96
MKNCEDKSSPKGRLNDGFKQRIVGALVLVALAVIFLPSLLDREAAKGYISEVSQIPAEPDIHPIEIAKPEPVKGVSPAPPADAAFQPAVPEQFSNPPAQAEQSAASPPADNRAQDSPTSSSNTPVAPKKGASPLVDAQGLPMAWVVQVASYREPTRAEQLRIRLMDKGYRAYTRAVQTDKGRLVRVLVGPKINKLDAQALKRELDTLLQTQTLILRF